MTGEPEAAVQRRYRRRWWHRWEVVNVGWMGLDVAPEAMSGFVTRRHASTGRGRVVTSNNHTGDYLAHFAAWDGGPLGPNEDLPPGFYGSREAPVTMLHYAGAWAMSTARRPASGDPVAAVYLRIVAGQLGTGPEYHVLDGVVDADVAEQWAEALNLAARRAREDIAAGSGPSS